MTFIANPIYDIVFKYLMEDDRVAKILLSALLKKDIIELQMRKQEYTAMQQTRISLFRMDFSAKIRDSDGSEHLVSIELQKTWLATETLRFRQYLGAQYLDKTNVREGKDAMYGLPIISIYILGHMLGDLKEPVVYVRRRYLDYDDNVLEQKDKFIESLTHDSIIVQIPYLQGRTRNRLERLLNIFDQTNCSHANEHFLEIDEEKFLGDDEYLVLNRLLKAGTTPDVRRGMEVEDEILSEIETRDTAIMQRDQLLGQKDELLGKKDELLGQKEQQIEQKDELLGQKEQQIEQKEQQIEQKDQLLGQKEEQLEQKNELLEQKDELLEQKKQILEEKELVIEQQRDLLSKMIRMSEAAGMSAEEIAKQFSISVAMVKSFCK